MPAILMALPECFEGLIKCVYGVLAFFIFEVLSDEEACLVLNLARLLGELEGLTGLGQVED